MKNKASLFLTILSTVALLGGIVSCNGNTSSTTTTNPNTGDVVATEYIVKFNNNYDGGFTKVKVKAGEKVNLPSNPTRTGYDFVGWFMSYRCNEDNTVPAFDANAPINADITVYAKWNRKIGEQIVTFHYMDNATPDYPVIVKEGQKVGKPNDPSYPDGSKAFTGWYKDERCTQLYDFDTAVTTSFDLYAGWKVSKATITFDYNYPGCPASFEQVVDLDKPMVAPVDPVREHYGFLGWYDRAVAGNKFDFTQNITNSMTLYAYWEENEFMVTFDLNGGKVSDTSLATKKYFTKGSSAATYAQSLIDSTTYEGHDFKGWFATKLDPDSDTDATVGQTAADMSNIAGATTFYAGWALSVYTVSFNLGYTDAVNPDSQQVKYGKTATEPATPSRDGYSFGGWFIDLTNNVQFTFDMPVTKNLDLTAKWIKQEETTPTTVKIKYYVGTTLYAEKEIAFNGLPSSDMPADPTKTDAFFDGWYTDNNTFTNKFNTKANLTQDINVYAKFLEKNTLEAEAVDLTGKAGTGSSTNGTEEQLIMDYTFIENGSTTTVSNGYFVRMLYYNGAFITFEVESDRDVSDAIMYLRVSSECYEFKTKKTKDNKEYYYLSDEEFKIAVNSADDIQATGLPPSDYLRYDGLYIPKANLLSEADLGENKTPFENCFIAEKLTLKKGTNFIDLYVDNNNNHSGTFTAEAPMIDCMYLYTSAKLTMTDYEFYTRPNVDRG